MTMVVKKKKKNPLLIILLILAGLWLLSQIYTEETPGETTNPTEPYIPQSTAATEPYIPQTTAATEPYIPQPTTAPPAEMQFPGVPEHLQNHLFLEWRGQGACEYLVGDVVVTMILVSDGESSWSMDEVATLMEEQMVAAEKLEADAARYGTYVNLRLEYLRADVTEILQASEHLQWDDTVLNAAGLPGYEEVSSYLEAKYGVESAPIFFYLNKMGRSYAQPAMDQGTEYSVVFLKLADFRHELNHLFGAKDYYFPQAYQTAAKQIFTSSMMLEGGPEAPVDSLTAYLMGWTDTLSPEAQAFLEQTASVTQEEISQELAEETFTGYTTRTLDYGVYTGDLVGGIFQGTGKLVYNSGDVYEGQWYAGNMHGQGTYRYADGGVYTGGWNNGTFHGQGTLQYADGSVYSGQWENGKISGYGVIRWANGDVYEGEWANNTLNGYGTLTRADGTVTTGTWKDGAFVQ